LLDPRAWAHLAKIVNYYNYAHVEPRRLMRCGAGARISPVATFANGRHIALGARVLVGENTRLWAGAGGARIVVGDDTLIGPNVLITAASYRFRDGAPIAAQRMREADVVVGPDVWIGAGAIVLAGSAIGAGSVVAAGAVVRGAFGPGAILAGNPAREIGRRTIEGDASAS
jgi:acetyltransferase-like isoleucine patch superfamily enzyme